ncbi:AAA family ATPase [Microbacterium sp. NPDC055988]|uniref:AAA family ATPase n=1 Tax=Microbacterium sp. NPDC055988 TaxID=3345671 RepID=UPI0035DE0A2A
MPLLVLLNGVPASGKSTTAFHWASRRPLALALDIDVLRSMLGGWTSDPVEAGLTARRLAVQMIRSHLSEGKDVIVPQFIGVAGIPFIEDLARVAAEVGATFREVALVAPADVASRRWNERVDADHPHGRAALVHGPLEASMAHAVLAHEEFLRSRADAIIVDSADGDALATSRRLDAALRDGHGV